MCTLIGTSTNLLVHGLMIQNGLKGLEMFELVKIGLPIAIIGSLYTSIFGYRLLKERKSVEEEIGERPKEYLIEMQLDPGSPLCHKSISNAGLWGLDGVYILAIERENESLESLNEYEILYPKDRLVFSGNIQSLEDLKGFPGLYFVEEQEFYKDFQHISKHLVEVVVSPRFPGLRKTIEEFDFQQTYGAVVLAVHRNGERINGKIGAIRLRPGDNLILLATNKFTTRWKNSQDFYLVSSESEINEVKPVRAIFSVILLIGMVLGATLGSHWSLGSFQFDMFFFALLVTLLMVWTKCFESRNYTRYISWDVLITIACAFGISSGLTNSGAANLIARELISTLMNFGPVGILAGIYFLTLIFTEVITNNAAAALMFPIALQTAQNMDVSPRPFIIAIAIAASASFSTPIGYQTNLIVQGIGNYKFRDFLKIGIPLSIITMVLAVSLIPRFWSF
jgi:di/tricarboxylate transporter